MPNESERLHSKLAAWLARVLRVFILLAACTVSAAGQEAVRGAAGFTYENETPAFSARQGPRLIIHRVISPFVKKGKFEPFRTLAESDGFAVSYLDTPVSPQTLAATDVFVIANAFTRDYRKFSTLEAPSVYSDDEISLLFEWVRNGGSLLVLADHSPFAGGTIKLAGVFGFTYMTGYAISKKSLPTRMTTAIDFTRNDGLLAEHPITNGATGRQPITHFFGFGGQAIIPPPDAVNILKIPSDFETVLSLDPRKEFEGAPRIDCGGFSQGSALEVGAGRLVIIGETGGFTSQVLDGDRSFGFDAPPADENKEFVLATLRWLARFTPP